MQRGLRPLWTPGGDCVADPWTMQRGLGPLWTPPDSEWLVSRQQPVSGPLRLGPIEQGADGAKLAVGKHGLRDRLRGGFVERAVVADRVLPAELAETQ